MSVSALYSLLEQLPLAIALINKDQALSFANHNLLKMAAGSISDQPFNFLGIDPLKMKKYFEQSHLKKEISFNHIVRDNEYLLRGWEVKIQYFPLEEMQYLLTVKDVSLELNNFKSFYDNLSDLQQIRSLKFNLELKNQNLEEMQRQQGEFTSMITHDLRTPITVIRGYATILLQTLAENLSAQQKDILQKIIDRSGELSNLINDTLDLKKMELGKMNLVKTEVDLSVMLQKIQNDFQLMFQEKNLSLSLNFDPEQSYKCLVDENKMQRVFSNFLSNAYKFTPAGKEVKINLRRKEDQILVEVKDQGIGIAKEDISKVFEKFQQINNPLQRDYHGTGLGMPIVKEIIELHDGKVWLESELGQGTSFFFQIPLGL
ncbi:MAG TPA: HAMP domain-containing sensor histidine kinase [Candidatus Gracilibacteria bacterium]|nr:HAMP domain-containing sensor histidine kinase [Candidatus Gracilibacteria bacterium]